MTSDQTIEMAIDTAAGFRQFVRLESIDPDRNRFRFFVLSFQPTLWDGPALVRTWGRVGVPGRSQVVPLPDGADPQVIIRRVLRRRLSHGYVVTAWR